MPDVHRPVVAKMEQHIARWEAEQDARSVFLSCYRLMTLNMYQALEEGQFDDPAWVGALLEHFAGYFFIALEAYEAGDPATPEAWQIAFEAAKRPGLSPIQHLLLGVNAHINYDLVLAEVDLLDPEWAGLTLDQRARRQADHERVNQVIGETIDAVQDTILEPLQPRLEILDRLMGGLDEWLISRLIRHWRAEVWEAALNFLETPDPDSRANLRQMRSTQVVRMADSILL
jgi:hypothetical protein